MKKGETLEKMVVERYDEVLQICGGDEDLCQEVILTVLDNIDHIDTRYKFSVIIKRYADKIISDRAVKQLRRIDAYDCRDELIKLSDCSISFNLEDVLLKDEIVDLLSILSELERQIIVMRFWQKMRLEEVGKTIGSTRDRARRIEADALEKLRKNADINMKLFIK